MSNSKTINLTNATIIISDDSIACYDASGKHITLTSGQQKLLKKMAYNLNQELSYSTLYASYTNSFDSSELNSTLKSMKGTFPACIRKSIKNIRGSGYKLEGTDENSKTQISTKNVCLQNGIVIDNSTTELSDLVGDYYGYYLDPLGSGNILNMYLHIQNEPEVNAYAILDIRSDHVLMDKEISKVFNTNTTDYSESYQNFKKTLKLQNNRCSWGQGSITLDGNLAIIKLNIDGTDAKWHIIISMENYIKANRAIESEDDYYRGGLSLVLASRTTHGTYCFRLGLIRKTLLKNPVFLKDEEVVDKLKILDDSKDANLKTLQLSSWSDKCWYNWMMNKIS